METSSAFEYAGHVFVFECVYGEILCSAYIIK